MRLPRSSGLLLHPTSLPGPYGIGDLGDAAKRFVDLLVAAKQHWWQVLPLGPTGFGDSPYQCFSAFAGNPLLISPDRLLADGLLSADDLKTTPAFPPDQVDFGAVIPWKRQLLRVAASRLHSHATAELRRDYAAFRTANAVWLDDYALFMALKDAHQGALWSDWEPDIAMRQAAALRRWQERLAAGIEEHAVAQFLFFRQWHEIRAYAAKRGVRVIGDIPIFVAYDSAEVWARPELFHLDEHGKPTVVAGVPPDYFSATGQLWGNPLYRWEVMASQRFGWWIERFRATLAMVDVVRVDHFIGFTRYWEIPANETTAVNGRYLPGPGSAFLAAVRAAFGALPLIAEDLGVVTPEVEALRDEFELPGMKVLQFAFASDAHDRFLPHNFTSNFVVYTGTHDNDTTAGWLSAASTTERRRVHHYLGRHGEDVVWDIIRLAMSSVADTCILPAQDVLSLGTAARMNFPGRSAGNWSWRYSLGQISEQQVARLREMVELYGREVHTDAETQTT